MVTNFIDSRRVSKNGTFFSTRVTFFWLVFIGCFFLPGYWKLSSLGVWLTGQLMLQEKVLLSQPTSLTTTSVRFEKDKTVVVCEEHPYAELEFDGNHRIACGDSISVQTTTSYRGKIIGADLLVG